MKKKILYAIGLVSLIGLIIFGMIANQPVKQVSKTYFYLGTVIDVTLYETEDQDILNQVSDMILYYDNLLSRTIDSSEVAQLNKSKGPLKVSEETYSLIEKSIQISKETSGYFDITINPIVELWAIGTDKAKVPTDEDIQVQLQGVDYKNIILNGDKTVQLLNNASIDLGGIAKGFIADEIATLLENEGIDKALINLGGNVMALGQSSDDQAWQIGIRHPLQDRSDVLLKLELEDKSVVTSGIYERFFEEDNQVYHHIFNPFTGYPMDNDILSLTVISDHSIDGDAYSTALFNLGLDKAFEKAHDLSLEIIVVTMNNKLYISKSLNDKITVFDDTFTIKIME